MDREQYAIISSELKKIGTKRIVKRHETLVYADTKVDSIYLIEDGGLVLLFVHPVTGDERAINFFIPDFHPIATVAESFITQKRSKYRLASYTNTTLIEITRSQLNSYLNSSSDKAFIFQQFGMNSLLEKNELRAMLISLNSEEMLQYIHQHYPEILQQVPSKYIANFLGITPQWLSKLKHKL